jgi:hypothetical protein
MMKASIRNVAIAALLAATGLSTCDPRAADQTTLV